MQNTKSIPICPNCFTLEENRQKYYGNISDHGILAEMMKKLDYCARCAISPHHNIACQENTPLKHKKIYEILANEFQDSIISGTLKIKKDKPCMVYLKIDDSVLRRIYARFAELRHSKKNRADVQLPPYYPDAPSPFSNPIGAHITIISTYELMNYPELLNYLPQNVNDKPLSISFKNFKKIIPVGWKQMEKVWIMTFDSPDIKKFRLESGLPLQFSNHELHATFAVLNRISSHAELQYLGAHYVNFSALQLSRLLNDANSHQNSIAWLFFQIAAKFNLSTDNLDPLSGNDWLKLLARTLDPDLIDLGCNIWQENQYICQINLDLLLFQALTLTEPNLALHHFCDMHSSRKTPLTTIEYLTCLNLIVNAYKKQPLKIGLKRLIPILSDLIDQNKILENPAKKNFISILIYIIKLHGCEDFNPELLLKSISEDFIHPSLINSEVLNDLFFREPRKTDLCSSEIRQKTWIVTCRYLLEHKDKRCFDLLDRLIDEESISSELPDIFYLLLVDCLKELISIGFQDPKNFSRLNRLINIAPPSKDAATAELLTGFFNNFFKIDRKEIAESQLGAVEELVFKFRELLYKLENWNNDLFTYLNYTRASKDRPHLLELFSCLLQKCKRIKEVELLRTFAKLIDKYFPPYLPLAIQQHLTTRKENPIETFNNLKEFEVAKIYIHLYSHYKLPIKNSMPIIWSVCFELSRKETALISIIELLEIQDKISWQIFFSHEKNIENLNYIPDILNRFFQETNQLNENSLKWVSFLFSIYLESPLSAAMPFIPGCSEDKFIEIALQLLNRESSLILKKYLLMRTAHNSGSENAARNEIDNQLKLKMNTDLRFCLDLRNKYFTQDASMLLSIIQSLHKDKNLIPIIIDEIEKLKLVSVDGALTCWIAIFEYLKRSLNPRIWDFLEQLPEIFDLKNHSSAREAAKYILITGATLKMQKKNRSIISKKEEYFKHLIWTETKKLHFPSSDIYLSVFSLLDENFIISNFEECLFLGQKFFASNPDNLKKKPFFLGLKTNFQILINQYCIQDNFKLLIDGNDRDNDKLSALEMCIKFCCKTEILTASNFHSLVTLIQTILETRYSNFSLRDNSTFSNGPLFFDLYYLFSHIPGFSIHLTHELIFLAIKFLNKTNIYLNGLWINVDPQSIPMTYEKYQNNSLVNLSDVGFKALLPHNCEKFDEDYLETIFKLIDQLDDENNFKVAMNKCVIERFLKIMKIKEDTNKTEFFKTKIMFERAMDWKINSVCSFSMSNFALLNSILIPLTEALKLNVYHKDKWFLTRVNLLQENEKVIMNLFPKEKEEICEEIIKKLIEINTEETLVRAWIIFFKYLQPDYALNPDLRINLFREILKISSDAFVEFEGKSIQSYIYSEFHELLVNKSLTDRRSKHYFSHIFNSILEANLACINQLKIKAKNKDFTKYISQIPHYIMVSLNILEDLVNKDLVEVINEEHFSKLEKIICPLIEMETLYLEHKIEISTNSGSYAPRHAIAHLLTNIMLKHKQLSKVLNNRQFGLIMQVIEQLVGIKVEPTYVKAKCHLILEILLWIIFKSNNQNKQGLEPSFRYALTWLKTQNLNPSEKFIEDVFEYHFQDFKQEDENLRFLDLSTTLFKLPSKKNGWTSLNYILFNRIQTILSMEPQNTQYRNAALSFSFSQLEFLSNGEYEDYQYLINSVVTLLAFLIGSKISETEVLIFEQLKQELNQAFINHNLHMVPLEFIDLMLKIDNMPMDMREKNIQLLVLPLAKFYLNGKNQIVADNFVLLFEKVPNLKDTLNKAWKNLVQT